jgi:MFS family permease
MGRAIAFVGLLVSIPTWILWLAAAHSHGLPETWEAWLLGVLCVGMGTGFVAAIGYSLRAALATGRAVYWIGMVSASISEAIVFGTLIHHRTSGEWVGDLLGAWSVWLYIAIGGAYVLSVVALPPAADDEIKERRGQQAERLEKAEVAAERQAAEAARQRQRAEELGAKVERLMVLRDELIHKITKALE